MGNVFDVLGALSPKQISSCDRLILVGDNRGFACDCWRLTRQQQPCLLHSLKQPHVGLFAMAASCEAWSRDRFQGHPPYRFKIEPGRVAVSEYVEWDLQKNFVSTWPIPIENTTSEIWLVLREWVRIADEQSEQREKYGRHLQAHPRWKQAVEAIKLTTQPQLPLFPMPGDEYIEEYPGDLVVMSSVRQALQSCGLPTTPSIIEYALSEAGYPYLHHGIGPAAEVLVESLCMVDTSLRPQRGEVLSSIAGSSLARNQDLWNAAYRAMAEHQDWWARAFETLAVDLRRDNKGRARNTPLNADVAAVIAGKMTRANAYEREKERRQAFKGEKLTPLEEQKAEQLVRKTISNIKNSNIKNTKT